ncbi:PLC-like phosphodiesterase [Flagelloscypha sp. PMI_526]|nr:PLC-like phosphodiesterase [Flagelloscypha sp. PMI_526]
MLKAKNLIVAHELEQSRGETPSQQPAVLVADLDESSSESEKEGGGLVHGLLSKIKRKPKTSSEKPKMSFALASLLVYTVGVKCRGFDKTTYSPEHIFSLSESSGKKICGTEGFLKHAQTHLVRTYPKGLRVSSSNYLPHTFWACGAQLVAINVQTFGHFALMMNWASFKRNGRAGYLLKPSPLRAETLEPLRKMHRYRFNCTVISGQHLPRPRNEDGKEDTSSSLMDPYVQITIHVPDWSINKVSGETETHLTPKAINFSTKIVHNNGFSPQWNEECSLGFECAADEMLDLVFVHFQVKLKGDDDDDIPVAQYCSPLSEVEKGASFCFTSCSKVIRVFKDIVIYRSTIPSYPSSFTAHS